MRIDRRHTEGDLMRIGLAHNDGARGLEFLDYRRVFARNEILEKQRTGRGSDSFGFK